MVKVVINFVFCLYFIRVMAHVGYKLVKLIERDNVRVEFHGSYFGVLVPIGVTDTLDFERFFDALFAHLAVAVNFEFFSDVARLEAEGKGGNGQDGNEEIFHTENFCPQNYAGKR